MVKANEEGIQAVEVVAGRLEGRRRSPEGKVFGVVDVVDGARPTAGEEVVAVCNRMRSCWYGPVRTVDVNKPKAFTNHDVASKRVAPPGNASFQSFVSFPFHRRGAAGLAGPKTRNASAFDPQRSRSPASSLANLRSPED